MSDHLKTHLGEVLSGMKRISAQKRLESGDSLYEGKKLVSFDIYKKICANYCLKEKGVIIFLPTPF